MLEEPRPELQIRPAAIIKGNDITQINHQVSEKEQARNKRTPLRNDAHSKVEMAEKRENVTLSN